MAKSINSRPIIRPGTIPARNKSLTDAPDAIPYMINGMLGGMITPSPPATATMAVAKTSSYPSEVSIGIVILPTAATVAGAEPEIAP